MNRLYLFFTRVIRRLARTLGVGAFMMFAERAYQRALLSHNAEYDQQRFIRSAALPGKAFTQRNLAALITIDYHRLEKGLALAAPRPRFGVDVLTRMDRDINAYVARFGRNSLVDTAIASLNAYKKFHVQDNHQLPVEFPNKLVEEYPDTDSKTKAGGTKHICTPEVMLSEDDAKQLFQTRHSIRQFVHRPVAVETIRLAVACALHTPSVCNRQTWELYYVDDREVIDDVLSFQNGNRGFGHSAAGVFLVTVDLERFVSVEERNQGWIDGGMFAMSLIWALHSLGVASCALNWSTNRHRDRKFRDAMQLPESLSIIMMIAVGYPPAELVVAYSKKRAVDDVLHVNCLPTHKGASTE